MCKHLTVSCVKPSAGPETQQWTRQTRTLPITGDFNWHVSQLLRALFFFRWRRRGWMSLKCFSSSKSLCFWSRGGLLFGRRVNNMGISSFKVTKEMMVVEEFSWWEQMCWDALHCGMPCKWMFLFFSRRINVRIQRLGPATSKVPKIDSGGETKTS